LIQIVKTKACAYAYSGGDSMIKKSVLSLIAVAMIVSVLAAGCTSNTGTTSPTPSPTNTYTSTQGYTIKFPSDWGKPQEQQNGLVVFTLPTNNATENLNVQVVTLASNATLASVTKNITTTAQSYRDFVLLSPSENTTLSKLAAANYLYQATVDGSPLNVLQTWTVKDGKAYVITYKAGYGDGTVTNNTFFKYRDTAQQMIDSFQIT
jgi:eukaryotic-like serine/threonine-protein kinase